MAKISGALRIAYQEGLCHGHCDDSWRRPSTEGPADTREVSKSLELVGLRLVDVEVW